MINKSSRFALIASLCASHSVALIPADVELAPLPTRAQGSRFSRDNDNRATIAADLLAYRIQQDLSRPRNPFALAIV